MQKKIETPKEISVGKIYMINYNGWKMVRVVKLVGKKALVAMFDVDDELFVDTDKIKINIL